MSEELNNLVDDILKEKPKLHYENEELEAQGKLIKELCKENEQLHSIIKEVREYIYENSFDEERKEIIDELWVNEIKDILEILDKVGDEK